MPSPQHFLTESKRLRQRGRCLHFVNEIVCDSFISAHSISQKNQLALIAENGHVLRFNSDYSTLVKYKDRPMPKEIGIGKVSTFLGFCHAHDSSTFAEIDTQPLRPDKKMIALYGYRSLCREYFVKENARDSMRSMAERSDLSSENVEICELSARGHEIGLNSIERHKEEFERVISTKNFEDVRYVLFKSKSGMDLQLAGVLYPEYDFLGAPLQDLGSQPSRYELISFFTAPLLDGWGFCFTWHKSSDSKCVSFIESLATIVYEGYDLTDALIKFTFSCCENHAFRISWWKSLRKEVQEELKNRVFGMGNPFVKDFPNYLTSGIRNMASWEFQTVQAEMPENAAKVKF